MSRSRAVAVVVLGVLVSSCNLPLTSSGQERTPTPEGPATASAGPPTPTPIHTEARPTRVPVGAEPPPSPPNPTPTRPVAKNGHPGAKANGGGPPKIKEAYWNSWLRDQTQAGAATAVVDDHSYDVNFDLAAYDYGRRPGSAASVAPVDAGFARVLSEATGASLPIIVKPFILGRGLSFQPGRAETQAVDIDLERLREPPTNFTPDDALPAFADKVKSLRVTLGVKADGPGCAAVGISIWNADANHPLDYVVREIPVLASDTAAPPAGCGTAAGAPHRVTAGLVSLLAAGGSQSADAAFHLFEIKVGGDDPASVAVFMKKAEHPVARSWQLSRPLSTYVSSPVLLLERLGDARTRHDYSRLSEELTSMVLPTAAVRPEDQPDVDEARRELDEVLRTTRSPSVFVRLVDVKGKSVFLPLGLITVGDGLLAKRAAVVQPLPREDVPQSGRCIGAWTMVLPTSLGNDIVAPRFLEPVAPTPADRMTDWPAFTSYLKGRPADASKAEGLLLLAHHAGGRLEFVPNGPDSFMADNITRPFPPGSVAVLAACSVGQLTGDNQGLPLLTRLNDLGVDAVILSPFAVDGPFGARFAMNFASVVQKARSANEIPVPDLRVLFARTVEAVRADPAVGTSADEAYEFILAGNAAIPLCR
jgi:hypothetical protein